MAIPVALLGYDNIGNLKNRAFDKRHIQDESSFIVSSESSSNITPNMPFSITITLNATKAIPFSYVAARIDYDSTKISGLSVSSDQDTTQFTKDETLLIVSGKNQLQPTNMEFPTCYSDKTCTYFEGEDRPIKYKFVIKGILKEDLTQEQRPVRVTLWGVSESNTSFLWNEKALLPELKLGKYVKNFAPEFISSPVAYAEEGQPFTYQINTSDRDKDKVKISLVCPENIFCDKDVKPMPEIELNENILRWSNPVYSPNPYKITIYADDSKSTSTQTFTLSVMKKGESYFDCQFSPGIAVNELDYRVVTPLFMRAESSAPISEIAVSFYKSDVKEHEIYYTFTGDKKLILLDENSEPPLAYQFSQGEYTASAIIKNRLGHTYICDMTSFVPTPTITDQVSILLNKMVERVYAATKFIVATNDPPVFNSDPMKDSKPGISFVFGQAYSYRLEVRDPDNDPLFYKIVKVPGWVTVTRDTTKALVLNISGVPSEADAGSNLFSISVNDGAGHFITQTWVINVDYADNDIPKVTISKPSKAISVRRGNNFEIIWDVEDRNQVISFDILYTKDPSSLSGKTYKSGIGYRYRSYIVNTKNLNEGDYYFLVYAHDTFDPPAIGKARTPLVKVIAPPPPPPTKTPTPKPPKTTTPTPTTTVTTTPITSITDTPAVTTPPVTTTPSVIITDTPAPTPEQGDVDVQINSPLEGAKVIDSEFSANIRLVAGPDAQITSDKVQVFIDSQDVTAQCAFTTEKGKTITISYKSSVLLSVGAHTITVKAEDTSLRKGEKTVNFSIVESEEPVLVDFLGFKIPKSLYTIIIIGLILIAVALILPIILYFTWKRNDSITVSTPSTGTLGGKGPAPIQPNLTRTPPSPFTPIKPGQVQATPKPGVSTTPTSAPVQIQRNPQAAVPTINLGQPTGQQPKPVPQVNPQYTKPVQPVQTTVSTPNTTPSAVKPIPVSQLPTQSNTTQQKPVVTSTTPGTQPPSIPK